MKTVGGNVEYEIAEFDDANTKIYSDDLVSITEMYYKLDSKGMIVISNKADSKGILALTYLKYFGDNNEILVGIDEENLTSALLHLGFN